MGYFQAIDDAIVWGWKMAETNADGSPATSSQRAYNFMNNGGGAITVRMVMLGAIGLLIGLVSFVGNGALSRLDRIDDRLQRIEQVTPNFDSRILNNTAAIAAIRDGQTRLWNRVNDHDHRITVLEARQPH